jgi:hypothetical protein
MSKQAGDHRWINIGSDGNVYRDEKGFPVTYWVRDEAIGAAKDEYRDRLQAAIEAHDSGISSGGVDPIDETLRCWPNEDGSVELEDETLIPAKQD